MRLSLTLMMMILTVVPSCWRCWFGGVLGGDTEDVMNKMQDGNSFNCHIRRTFGFNFNASSSASPADNSYFLVGFALLYPLLMIITG